MRPCLPLVLVLTLALTPPLAAEVPQFRLKLANQRVEQSQWSPMEDKVLLKLIPEQRIAIYGNPEELLIISESPFLPRQARYSVKAWKNGKVKIVWYHDPEKTSALPEPMPRRWKDDKFDQKVIEMELPFTLKDREKKMVWFQDRLEISIPHRQGKGDLDQWRRHKRGFTGDR